MSAVLTAGLCCNEFNTTIRHELNIDIVLNATTLADHEQTYLRASNQHLGPHAVLRHASRLWQPREYAPFGWRPFAGAGPDSGQHDLCIIELGQPALGIAQWPGDCSTYLQLSLAHTDTFYQTCLFLASSHLSSPPAWYALVRMQVLPPDLHKSILLGRALSPLGGACRTTPTIFKMSLS